ncbi:LysR substrate-binding domain-containing protein [uncultured Sphingomonas sp.]|uniref:LysR substrate-binding domain-containing protein n=1 Tax=Sphingomonas sanguinis TaxID=33051 RepID=UPI0009E94919
MIGYLQWQPIFQLCLKIPCQTRQLPSGALYGWRFERGGEERAVHVTGRLTVDRAELMAEAALSGAGLDYVLESLATQELGNKRLVPVLADRRQPEPDLCLY